MKEATGELNMTVITVVAIAAVAAVFYAFVWPTIKGALLDNTCKSFGDEWHYVAEGVPNTVDYACCPKDVESYDAGSCQVPVE